MSGSLEVDKSSKFGLLFRVLRKRTNREILFIPKRFTVLKVRTFKEFFHPKLINLSRVRCKSLETNDNRVYNDTARAC